MSDSYQLRLLPMSSSTGFVSGMYGGYFSHGESQPAITYNDNSFNGTNYVPITTEFTASSASSTYRGFFEIDYNVKQTTDGCPNIHWHGNMRIGNVNSAHIAGACTGTQGNTYGVRITSNAASEGTSANGLLGYEYAVYGIPTS